MELALRRVKVVSRAHPVGKLIIQNIAGPTGLQPMLYQPIVALILQGKKRSMIGDKILEYGAGEYFVGAIDVPVLWQIIQASQSKPFVSVSMLIDPSKLKAIQLEMENRALPVFTAGFGVTQVEDELVGAFWRLLKLYDHPQDIVILEPLLEREILFRLLQGTQGVILRQLSGSDSRLSYIKLALNWMKTNFALPIHVEELASMTGMSVSVFHRHFKALTAMTPIQYQKQLRLHEARRRLVEESGDATGTAFSVGYESVSQFSREYARLFGSPPVRDAKRFHCRNVKQPTGTIP